MAADFAAAGNIAPADARNPSGSVAYAGGGAIGKDALPAASELSRTTDLFLSAPERHAPLPAAHPMAAPDTAGTAGVSSGTTTPAAASTLSVDPRVGDRGWDRALGEKLVWITSNQQQSAQLHLNPPELGPLKITITLHDNQATAQFASAHAQVRDAIESAMPRLREMLADSGISLGNASVSADAFREPQQDARSHAGTSPARTQEDPLPQRGERRLRSILGLVDTFA